MIKRELSLFLIVGALTVLVDFLIYRGINSLELMELHVAKGIGFMGGTAFAYCANRYGTFGHCSSAPGSAWRFTLLYTMTLGVNVGVNALALRILHALPWAIQGSFLIATGVSATLNFLGMKWLVFKAP